MSTPACRTITRFGGISACARALNYPKSTVQRWKTSGHILPKHTAVILHSAAKQGIKLSPSDFLDVDPSHPAFETSVLCIPSPDDTSAHAAGSSTHPTTDIVRSPSAAPNSDEGAGA
jgi:hypothetical protein